MSEFNLRNYLYNNPLINEEKTSIYELKKGEVGVVDFILGDEEINEVNFDKIKEKFNKALKKGAMTFGVLAAVLGSPNMSQAQKAELKKDVTDSTWFLDKETSFKNDRTLWNNFTQKYINNPDYNPDFEDIREPLTPDTYKIEKWVNNLGQDSTVYKQYQTQTTTKDRYGNLQTTYSNPGDPVKTVVDKDVKPWKTADFSLVTKKGRIGDYLWSKDKRNSITPDVYKALQKLEKGKEVNTKDRSSLQAKKYQDEGFSSSDFQKVDLDNIDSPSE